MKEQVENIRKRNFNETKYIILRFAHKLQSEELEVNSKSISLISGLSVSLVCKMLYHYTIDATKPYFRRKINKEDLDTCCIEYKLTKHGLKMLEKYTRAKAAGLTLNLRHPKPVTKK